MLVRVLAIEKSFLPPVIILILKYNWKTYVEVALADILTTCLYILLQCYKNGCRIYMNVMPGEKLSSI